MSFLDEKLDGLKVAAAGNERFRRFSLKLVGNKERQSIYLKVAKLADSGMPIERALSEIQARYLRKDVTNPIAIMLGIVLEGVRNGDSLGDALEGVAPLPERMLIKAGEDSADVTGALRASAKMIESTARMKAPVIKALVTPVVLVVLTILVLAAFSVIAVPQMAQAFDPEHWEGIAVSLYVVSEWVRTGLIAIPILAIMAMIALIVVTFPKFTGRVRDSLDKVPPWSMYRMLVGSGWLVSLSSLAGAGVPLNKALTQMREWATPYLQERIDDILIQFAEGSNLGDAMDQAGHGFPDQELIDDFTVYAQLPGFEEQLSHAGEEWLEDGIKTVEKQAAGLKLFSTFLLMAVVAWIGYGLFDIQMQAADYFSGGTDGM